MCLDTNIFPIQDEKNRLNKQFKVRHTVVVNSQPLQSSHSHEYALYKCGFPRDL